MAATVRTSTRPTAATRAPEQRPAERPKGGDRPHAATRRNMERIGWSMVGGGLAVGAAGVLASGTVVGAPVGVPAAIGGAVTAMAGYALLEAAGPASKAWDKVFKRR